MQVATRDGFELQVCLWQSACFWRIENGNQEGCGQHQGRFYLKLARCGQRVSGWSDVARKAAIEPGMVLLQGVVKSAGKAATTTMDGCFRGIGVVSVQDGRHGCQGRLGAFATPL